MFRSGQSVFRPRPVPTLATLLLLPVLISLGVWQLHRAEEKRALIAALEAGRRAAPLDVEAELARDPHASLRRYQHVLLRGCYDPTRQVLLDESVHEGLTGYRVLTPFYADCAPAAPQLWLVDRGWLPAAADRRQLPDVRFAARCPSEVTGVLDLPPRAAIELDGALPEGWPKLLAYPSAAMLSAAYGVGAERTRWLLRLDPSADQGYERSFTLDEFPPERHLAYALQWFAMGLALVVIWVVNSMRRSA